jgi:hypothetical protein
MNGDGTKSSDSFQRISFFADPASVCGFGSYPYSFEKADFSIPSRYGYKVGAVSPLHSAAFKGDAVQVRNILAHGVNPDLVTIGDPVTPLYFALDHYAAADGRETGLQVIDTLLEGGASADKPLFGGMNPLFHLFHLFLKKPEAPLAAAELLLSHGASTNGATSISINRIMQIEDDEYYEVFEPFSVALLGALQKGEVES